ncbi:MAG: M20/M25/M40 family metallo-hydrolase [Crocinitomicaceae bacterium]|nr:M20/M25/M40 family metallo-hydrolase [Crocinitomicaceae bacterium]
MHRLILLLISFLAFQSFGQVEPDFKRITRTLCSPEFHGRGYYKKGDSIAADFLVQEFKKIGVSPLRKKEYLQSFPLEGVNVFSGKMNVLNGSKVLKPGVHFMVDPESGGFTGKLNPIYLSGEKMILNEGTEINDDYIREKFSELQSSDLYNAILLDLSIVSGDSLKALMGFSKVLAESAPVIEVMNRKFTWSVGRKQLANPLIYIQDSIIDFKQGFTVDIESEFIETYQTQNVIASIPAKKKCAETIVFTAHYDHLGRMGDETCFPGANDNASGTSMLFTMAKHFKENPSDYNILFIAFAGEEAGLVGSKYFVEHPMLKLKKIEFLVNLDIMGSGEEGITAVNGTLFEKEFELLKEISEENQLLAKVKRRGPAANSDHYWFTKADVPSFFIYTMGPNKNYHDVFDVYEALSFQEYEDITTLLISFVDRLSELK